MGWRGERNPSGAVRDHPGSGPDRTGRRRVVGGAGRGRSPLAWAPITGTGVFVGFESLSGADLDASGKKTPSPADYARRVAILHDHGIQVNGSFVLDFDHDRPEVFGRTVTWVEAARLECDTFHILTPYPGTPLFRRMESEGQLLHRGWRLHDTAHVVYRPRHITPEELSEGYAWCYERLFSHGSIWRRRPGDWRAVPPYRAMSYLYKRSNRLWHLLIRHRLTGPAWRPLVAW